MSRRKLGLIASQIYKFVFEVKAGDTVIIPSANSEVISFGTITENHIADFSSGDARRVPSEAILNRRVKWLKDIPRYDLDPYLYRMFTAHQALNDVGNYADIIERSLKDFFILDNEAHLIINIQNQNEIAAADVFGLGSEILALIDDISREYDLGVSSKDLQVTINLNSLGKIDLKSKIKKVTLMAGLILAVFGGGYETKDGTKLQTPGIPGIIKAISEYKDRDQERVMKQQIFDRYKDSLQVKNPDDMIKLLKQVSDNKDVAK